MKSIKIETNGVLLTSVTARVTLPGNLRWRVVQAVNVDGVATARSNADYVEATLVVAIDTTQDGWITKTHQACRQVLRVVEDAQYHVQRVLDNIAEIETVYSEESSNV